MRILISACLLGLDCRYDGCSKPCAAAIALQHKHQLVPVCPEQLGGLTTPRPPCERIGACVVSNQGMDRTAEYTRGAQQALRLYDTLHCDYALLKARSPMCGKGSIYDGSFSGTLTVGDGVLAQQLLARRVTVYTEDEIDKLV